MKKACAVLALSASLVISGCVTTETTKFTPQPGQDVVIRDGRPAVVSTRASSKVVVAQISRKTQAGARPAYVVAIQNTGRRPVTLEYGRISATQIKAGRPVKDLHVYTVDELQQEERTAQIVGGLLMVAAAGAGAAVVGANTSNPYSAAWQSAAIGNATGAATGRMIAEGEINIAILENVMLKDNTVMPGEIYGGVIQFQGAAYSSHSDERSYRLVIPVGNDMHTFYLSSVMTR